MSNKDLNIVLPIKDPRGAKERLSPLLTPEQRLELAHYLIDQTFSFFNGFLDRAHVLVITDSAKIAQRAEASGFTALKEEQAEGETAAVERATEWSVAHGFRSQVVIPGDMARIDADELIQLLHTPRPDPSVILVPAVGDDGTNAILTTPPNVIPFRFGNSSFPDYCERAAQQNVPCEIVRLPSFVLDLDTPDDLKAAVQQGRNAQLREMLTQWQISLQ